MRGIEDRLTCGDETPNVAPHAGGGTVVGPLALGTNELPDETKVELDVCVVPQPARADAPSPGGRSPYDLVCVEDVQFPGFQE